MGGDDLVPLIWDPAVHSLAKLASNRSEFETFLQESVELTCKADTRDWSRSHSRVAMGALERKLRDVGAARPLRGGADALAVHAAAERRVAALI